MAPKILKSFSAIKSKSDQTKDARACLKKKINPKDPSSKTHIPLTTHVLKRKNVVDLTEDASKNPRIDGASFEPHLVALHHSGPLASVYMKDEEVNEWEYMSMEDATRASLKASAQLMFHSTHQVDKIIVERACLTRLDG